MDLLFKVLQCLFCYVVKRTITGLQLGPDPNNVKRHVRSVDLTATRGQYVHIHRTQCMTMSLGM